MELGLLTHVLAATAYLIFALVLIYGRWRGHAFADAYLIFATGVTALWAAMVAAAMWSASRRTPALPIYEVLRDVGWLVYALGVLVRSRVERKRLRPYLGIGVLALVGALAVVVNSFGLPGVRLSGRLGLIVAYYGHLLLAVAGLALAENLFRNTPDDRRWRAKFLYFAIGGIFAYDFFLYSHALLFRQIDPDLLAARGLTNAFVIPLLAVAATRDGRPEFAIKVSPRIVFHSVTLVGAALYLLLMAGTGYYLRRYGGNWGVVLQVAFLFGAVGVMVIALFSGSFRARVRTVLEKNFLRYKYDYREEWLRYIRTISATGSDAQLPTRVVQAVGDIIDSPEGAMWLAGESGNFELAAVWNLSRWQMNDRAAAVAGDSPFAAFLRQSQWIVNLDEVASRPERYDGLAVPNWLAAVGRAWLVVPLIRREQLDGFMVFGQPRAKRSLTWEDYDLLKTVGQQAASYLAEHRASQALAAARQFEEFNRRFTFVVHDIKNLASQLALVVSNAARHGQDAAFQADVIRTVGESVEKMKRLLLQLNQHRHVAAAKRPVALAPLVRKLVDGARPAGAAVELELDAMDLAVMGDEDRLSAVIGHLLQNASEAATESGRVVVRLGGEDTMAVLEVEDDGPGMDPEFVRERLFQPFKTTKASGYGIGAFECRELARAMGGRLDVITAPGEGTTMRLSLPLAELV